MNIKYNLNTMEHRHHFTFIFYFLYILNRNGGFHLTCSGSRHLSLSVDSSNHSSNWYQLKIHLFSWINPFAWYAWTTLDIGFGGKENSRFIFVQNPTVLLFFFFHPFQAKLTADVFKCGFWNKKNRLNLIFDEWITEFAPSFY